MKESKVLDQILYLACLSGSTWTVTDWIFDLNDRKGDLFSHTQEKNYLEDTDNIFESTDGFKEMIKAWTTPVGGEENVLPEDPSGWFVERWGKKIAEKFLPGAVDSTDSVQLHQMLNKLKDKEDLYPWPIMTAVDAYNKDMWFEFTPSTVCQSDRKVANWQSVKSEFFGNMIDLETGKTLNNITYGDLVCLLVIWGSAPCADAFEAADFIMPTWSNFVKNSIGYLGQLLLWAADTDFFLFPYPVSNWYKSNPLRLRDAGFSHNLPFAPLLCPERKVDIIIVLDASDNEQYAGQQLILASRLYKKLQYPFPSEDTIKKKIKIQLQDHDKLKVVEPILFNETFPHILYVPVHTNDLGLQTTLFYYTNEQKKNLYERIEKQFEKVQEMLHNLS